MLVTDLSRAYRLQQGGRFKRILTCCFLPGFQAVKVYRFGHWLLGQPKWKKFFLRPLEFLLHQRMRRKWGIDIVRQAKIGPGFLVFHFGGIFIGDARIGRNCSIRHNTTIGVGGTGAKRGIPTIGNNVYIAPGVIIAGQITIGDNVKIGANSVVQRDIPDNALVHVRPAQVVTFPILYGDKRPETIPHRND
jgi:serine O-acetyltransferase